MAAGSARAGVGRDRIEGHLQLGGRAEEHRGAVEVQPYRLPRRDYLGPGVRAVRRIGRPPGEALQDTQALHGVRAPEGDVGQLRDLEGGDLLLDREQVDQFVGRGRGRRRRARRRRFRCRPQRVGRLVEPVRLGRPVKLDLLVEFEPRSPDVDGAGADGERSRAAAGRAAGSAGGDGISAVRCAVRPDDVERDEPVGQRLDGRCLVPVRLDRHPPLLRDQSSPISLGVEADASAIAGH